VTERTGHVVTLSAFVRFVARLPDGEAMTRGLSEVRHIAQRPATSFFGRCEEQGLETLSDRCRSPRHAGISTATYHARNGFRERAIDNFCAEARRVDPANVVNKSTAPRDAVARPRLCDSREGGYCSIGVGQSEFVRWPEKKLPWNLSFPQYLRSR